MQLVTIQVQKFSHQLPNLMTELFKCRRKDIGSESGGCKVSHVILSERLSEGRI
jgi:hypothetical protein